MAMRFPIRFLPDNSKIDFIGKRWVGFAITIALIALSFFFLATKGLNLGIDFTGGIMMDVRSESAPDLSKMREALDGKGLGEVSLQNAGDPRNVLIRIQMKESADQSKVVEAVKALLKEGGFDKLEYRQIDYVGPTVGQELMRDGFLAMLLSFAAIMGYLWFRFELQYGLGGILALVHDGILTLGFFSVTGFEFGLPSIAAILTILGYSINDSVVIYDRIRENMRKYKKMPIAELLNLSLNETLSRTIMTVMTTLLAVLALYLFGGEVIHGFSASILFGIVIGTFSSIYISAPVLIYLNIRPNAEEKAPVGAGA